MSSEESTEDKEKSPLYFDWREIDFHFAMGFKHNPDVEVAATVQEAEAWLKLNGTLFGFNKIKIEYEVGWKCPKLTLE